MTGRISEHISTALKQTLGEINAISGRKTKMGQVYLSGTSSETGSRVEISWPKFI